MIRTQSQTAQTDWRGPSETSVAEPIEEVVSILAEALLEMLVPVMGQSERKFSDTP